MTTVDLPPLFATPEPAARSGRRLPTGGLAVVTGGSRGVGLAVARRLAAAEHPLLLTYRRDRSAADTAAAELRSHGADVTLLPTDLATDGLDAVLDHVDGRGERLGVLVHAAADYAPAPTLASRFDGFCDAATVTLAPLLDGAPRVLQAMAGGPGRVVAVSSIGSGRAVPYYANLGMAKAALESLVRYLAVEFAPHGVTVNAVSTAKIDKSCGTDLSPHSQKMAARTPAGRLTTDADVADVVGLLCSAAAGWIHGQVVVADGGLSLTV